MNRIFYNIKNNKFNSFCFEGIHNDIIFSEYKFLNDGTIESVVNNNFVEISKKEYDEIISKKGIIKLEKEKLIVKEIPACDVDGVNVIFNEEKWIWEETATVQEQLEYYKQKIIECTKEIYIEERAGFKPSEELLQKKEHYSNLHMSIAQPEAIKINKHIDSTKPAK